MRRPLLISSQFDVLELVSSISHKGSVITMGKHKSVEAKRLTELGQGLYAWGKVMHGWMFNSHVSVADCSAKAAMREIALMEDTYENSKLLREAAYCCGLPEREADGLKGVVVSLLRYERGVMCDELAEYVRGTWPDAHEFADMVEEGDDDVAATWLVEPKPESCAIRFTCAGNLVVVWLDTDAAESIAMSCPDLDYPPIGIAVAVNDGGVEHMVCTTVDQAVEAVVDRIHRFDTEGK